MNKLNINEAKERFSYLDKENKYWYSQFSLFEEKFNKKILPIISSYNRYPIRYKINNVFSIPILDYFKDDFHYYTALHNLMCFVRNENYWNYSFRIINKILGKDNEYGSCYNTTLLESNCLENIGGEGFHIFHEYTLAPKIYKNIIENKEYFRKHVELWTTGDFNTKWATDDEKKLILINKIFKKRCLSKEFIEMFLYAEEYHEERIYKVVIKDIRFALEKAHINPDSIYPLLRHIVYLLTIAIENSLQTSKHLFWFSNQQCEQKELNYFMDYSEGIPLLHFK